MTHTHILLEAPGLFAKVPDLARRIAQAVKFDAGTADNLPSVPPDLWRPEYMRLPYPQTVVEFIVEGPESEGRIGTRIWTLAMEQVDEETIHVGVFSMRPDGTQRAMACGYFLSVDGATVDTEYCRHMHNMSEEAIAAVVGPTANGAVAFLLALQCKGVGRELRKGPKLINRKRVAKGRPPIDDFWVLTISSGGSGEGSGGGTSPRMHWRRGHIRRLPSGALTWVRHCMVGRAENGRIEKEYRLN